MMLALAKVVRFCFTFCCKLSNCNFSLHPRPFLRAMPRSGIGFADLPESMLLYCVFSIFCFDKWFWPALPEISLPRRICKKSSRWPSNIPTPPTRRGVASFEFANKFLNNYVLLLFYRALNAKIEVFNLPHGAKARVR